MQADLLDERRRPALYSTSTRPAGASMAKRPGVRGTTSPSSIATVTVPMVPWPHIGRQPLTSIYSTPNSQSSRVGGYRMEPDMTSCPRGSNIRARRTQS